jgi:hypothetical protein
MRPRLYAMIGLSIPAALIGMILLANCGGTKNSGSGGSGSGAGGGSAGGSTGAGGTCPAAMPLACGLDGGGTAPASLALTDFSAGGDAGGDGGTPSWSMQNGKWGIPGNLTGSIFAYRGPKTSMADWPGPMVTNGALTDSGQVASGDYVGIGMTFDQCVNAPNFKGVSFTLTGSTGGCTLVFDLQTLDEQATSNMGLCDTCMNTCYLFPTKTLNVTLDPTTPTPVTVLFTDLENSGMPATAAAFSLEMIGLQWQLQAGSSGACMGASLAVTDVAFTE